MDTIRETIKEMEHPPEPERLAVTELDILRLLPEDLPPPTISNIVKANPKRPDPTDPTAWINWSPCGAELDAFDAGAHFRAMESAGWSILPATLCRWDDYMASPEFGDSEDIPDSKPGCFGSNYKLNDCEPIAPMWAVLENNSGAELLCYMRGPDGRNYRISVDCRIQAHISARRKEYRGGWEYESGSVRLNVSDRLQDLRLPSGEVQAQLSASSRAFRGAGMPCQYLHGRIYWTPVVERFDWKASQLAEYLTAKG